MKPLQHSTWIDVSFVARARTNYVSHFLAFKSTKSLSILITPVQHLKINETTSSNKNTLPCAHEKNRTGSLKAQEVGSKQSNAKHETNRCAYQVSFYTSPVRTPLIRAAAPCPLCTTSLMQNQFCRHFHKLKIRIRTEALVSKHSGRTKTHHECIMYQHKGRQMLYENVTNHCVIINGDMASLSSAQVPKTRRQNAS